MAFPDDDPESKFPPDDPNLLKNRSIPQRALVISAGVVANVIFAYSLLFTQASLHPPRPWLEERRCVQAFDVRMQARPS